MDTIIQPVARPSKRGSYRRHSDEFKLAVVTQSLLPKASVSRIAREHNINANQVFAWRKLFADGQLAPSETACALLPVTLAAPPLAPHVLEPMRASPGVIELTVGKARLRLEGTVDTAVLNLVLRRLQP
jgi:transposase